MDTQNVRQELKIKYWNHWKFLLYET